jgi:hypothetical protein
MEIKKWHLAQLNIGKMVGMDITDPVMKYFVDQLDEVNALAENSKGFVWRLKDDNNNATSINPFGDQQIIVNMSVWESIEDLESFVYKGRHVDVLRRRKEWFSKMKFYMAMWYVPAGVIPTTQEAIDKLHYLEINGPSPDAFDFKQRFTPPSETTKEKI